MLEEADVEPAIIADILELQYALKRPEAVKMLQKAKRQPLAVRCGVTRYLMCFCHSGVYEGLACGLLFVIPGALTLLMSGIARRILICTTCPVSSLVSGIVHHTLGNACINFHMHLRGVSWLGRQYSRTGLYNAYT